EGLEFTILSMEERRIETVHIEKKELVTEE
ncbi:MAG: hypothetical protein IKA63_00175, partial [Clostridia bacterium]|nr:hypothetical protein [Clostridia bacterium]